MDQLRGAEKQGRPGDPMPEQPSILDVAHRRNRLAGLWAAELLGLIGQAAQDYARSVIHPDHPQDEIHEDDQDKVVHKLSRDLAGRANIAEIREKMTHFLSEARRQLTDRH